MERKLNIQYVRLEKVLTLVKYPFLEENHSHRIYYCIELKNRVCREMLEMICRESFLKLMVKKRRKRKVALILICIPIITFHLLALVPIRLKRVVNLVPKSAINNRNLHFRIENISNLHPSKWNICYRIFYITGLLE